MSFVQTIPMEIAASSLLIVDDEPLNCEVFGRVLKKAGYITLSAGNGDKAIELLKMEKFDLVLLDINMPKTNGVQVLEHIKSNQDLRDIPVIMVTAEHDNETVLHCINTGAADYIKKPIEPALLRSRVWRCLKKHKGLGGSEPEQIPESHAKAHILMVDDDEMHRALVNKRLAADNHSVRPAQSGLQALKALEESEFDLILLDVMMPDLDGFQTLEKIKANDKYRHIPVIMLSADDRPETIDKCLKAGADDFIMKPFNAALLQSRIQSCLVIDANGDVRPATQTKVSDIVPDLVQRLRNDKINFPVMPEIAVKINRLLKENEDVGPQDICEIIKTDPALTLQLISMSNTSYYRGAVETKTLEDALVRLGMRETQNYLLLFTNRALFNADTPPFNKLLDKLWLHSMATAETARLLGKTLKHKDLNHLFTLGMLHDMGKLLLLQVLIELKNSGREMDETSINEILDSQHMSFGAALMRKWNFSDEFITITQQHHDLAEDDTCSQELLIVSLANLVTRKSGYSLKEDDGENLPDCIAARKLGIDARTLDNISEQLVEYITSMHNT